MLRGTGVGPLEVAVEALAGAVVRALRNTGVGRGAIALANGYGALTVDPLLAGKSPQGRQDPSEPGVRPFWR